MKTRAGFVSNSSSSSFVLKTDDLTDKQVNMIWNHIEFAQKIMSRILESDDERPHFGSYYDGRDAWIITEDEGEIRGYTNMDNFSMMDFLSYIGVDMSKVTFD